jgi:uncharacterized protein
VNLAYYLDSSALVKRYVQEDGSSTVDQLFQSPQVLITSSLTYAEIYAALCRLHRAQNMNKQTLTRILAHFEDDWQDLHVIDFHTDVRSHVPTIIREHPLRGADVVQLASALSAHERNIDLRFVCADHRLCNAATDVGLSVTDPSHA